MNKIFKILPKRIVVLGSKGFVGKATCKILKLKKIPVLELSREQINLQDKDATSKLNAILTKEDFLIIAAANAPVKNNEMLIDNISMMKNIINSIIKTSIKRVIYISSDAVYSDIKKPMNEESSTQPQTLHGIMHLTREIMLKQIEGVKLSILRPTLIYGIDDPHNGYGPNQFFNLASIGRQITLFGEGEELRDHVCIDDVSKLTANIALSSHEGILNIASGEIHTFRDIAEIINKLFKDKVLILKTLRKGKMPHDGYRSFDTTKIFNLFPEHTNTSIYVGLKNYYDNL